MSAARNRRAVFLVTSEAVQTIGGRVRCIVPIPLLAREPSFRAATTAFGPTLEFPYAERCRIWGPLCQTV